MMMLDTGSWVEFFRGTQKGEKVREVISKGQVYTSMISLAELSTWCLKNRLNVEDYLKVVKTSSVVLKLSPDIIKKAGSMNYIQKRDNPTWNMLDSLIYATSRVYKLDLMTDDEHMKGMDGVVEL